MQQIQRVSLIGLGAVGSAYLSVMADTIPLSHIRVIAGGSRAQRLRQSGTVINGKRYNFPICQPEDAVEPADLLIFATKYGGLQQAIADAKGHVGPQTLILSLLNGISSEDLLIQAFGEEKVLYGLTAGIDAVRTQSGVTFTTLGNLPFGDAKNDPANLSARVLRVQEFFQRAGIPHTIPADMMHTLWWKFMLNVGINQVTALLRAPYGSVQCDGEARRLMIDAIREVVTISQKAGVNLTEEDVGTCLATIDALTPHSKTSMCQDVEAGRPTELAIFGGAMVEMGRRYGVSLPVNEMLYRLLNAYEQIISRR